MEDDIISILFEKKIDSDMFNFSSEELTRWEKAKRKYSDELFMFIGQRVHPKSQKKIEQLVEKYLEAKNQCFYIENKMYYKSGFVDGMNLIHESCNNR